MYLKVLQRAQESLNTGQPVATQGHLLDVRLMSEGPWSQASQLVVTQAQRDQAVEVGEGRRVNLTDLVAGQGQLAKVVHTLQLR